jgi:hypothetical protein
MFFEENTFPFYMKQNNITSSTNNKCVGASNLPILTPFILLIPLASLMALLDPFSNKRKRQGESGKSCRIPLEDLKNFYVDPLINTIEEEVVTHPIIHLTKGSENPTWIKSRLAFNHETISYTL